MKNEEEGIWGRGSPIGKASPVALVVKNLSADAGDIRDMGSMAGLGRFPRGGTEEPGRSIGSQELDMTEST